MCTCVVAEQPEELRCLLSANHPATFLLWKEQRKSRRLMSPGEALHPQGPEVVTPAAHLHLSHLLEGHNPPPGRLLWLGLGLGTWWGGAEKEREHFQSQRAISKSTHCGPNSKPTAWLRKSVECMQLIRGQISRQTKY